MPHTGHPRDISDARLAAELLKAEHPELLYELVELARETFGFFSQFTSHHLTNPWFADALTELAPGDHLLDMGSGLGPVPVWAARRGVNVTCVDSHPVVRAYPIQDDWTEWGYFDYATISNQMRSFNVSVDKYKSKLTYSAISSVCVFSHIARSQRDHIIHQYAHRLRAGGIFCIAVDLLAGTNFIWNRADKKVVAPPEEHGSITDLLSPMMGAGLVIERLEVFRNIKDRPDLFMVAGRKPQ